MAPESELKLFGTDGIRARAGDPPLDSPSLARIGSVLGDLWSGRTILLAMDTRASGPGIGDRLIDSLGTGVQVDRAGVLPTPAVSLLVRRGGYDHGIMITASHNPFQDNGLKFFNSDGDKMAPEWENLVQTRYDMHPDEPHTEPPQAARSLDRAMMDSLRARYVDYIQTCVSGLVGNGRRCVIDCANGSLYSIAPEVLSKFGFEVTAIHTNPDGENINRGCGATDLDSLISTVMDHKAPIGFAFDGDGDRVLAVDSNGRILDGDHLLYLIATNWPDRNSAGPATVVGTVMSNLGFEKALESRDISLARVPVGDRNVAMKLKQIGGLLGGEPSGHIILRHQQATGDGLLTALTCLFVLDIAGLEAAEVYDAFPLFPQAQRSLQIRKKRSIEEWKDLQLMLKRITEDHASRIRVVIRYSGTEPKIRIMIEADDQAMADRYLEKLCHLIQSEIGV